MTADGQPRRVPERAHERANEHWVSEEPFTPEITVALTPEQEKFYSASQWQLMWWRFRRHKIAMLALWVLGIFYGSILITEILAPYSMHTRNPAMIHAPPQGVRIFHEGALRAPFTYGVKMTLDMTTLQRRYETDTTQVYPIRFFCAGDSYLFWAASIWSVRATAAAFTCSAPTVWAAICCRGFSTAPGYR